MEKNPYAAPRSEESAPTALGKYATYAEVPVYRRQWFFWLFWFFCAPLSIVILLFGDIYYVRRGEVRAFGMANRVVAGIIGLFWAFQLIVGFMAAFMVAQ